MISSLPFSAYPATCLPALCLILWLGQSRFGRWRNRLPFFWAALLLSGCASRSPVAPGLVLKYNRSPSILSPSDPNYSTTLQVRWLGTACYVLQLGDRVLFTDPFLTHQSLCRVELGGTLKPDPAKVAKVIDSLPVPQALFIGHSHYDHLLDAAGFLGHPNWRNVPVYGSTSTRNILCGYGCELSDRWHPVVTNTDWQPVSPGIRYKAFSALHGRQLPLLPLLYPGRVEDCRKPNRASEFKVGDCYAFVFELANERVSYTVYFIGAAHADEQGLPDEPMKPVDVAILCVPTWKLSHGYPSNIIERLKPAHIVASHYDDFFQVNGKEPNVVALADMDGFLQLVQRSACYCEFEDILVPSVGSVLLITKKGPR